MKNLLQGQQMNSEIPESAPLCAAPNPHTLPPRHATPASACDCHAHILGPISKFPYDPIRVYTPPDALLADYRAMLNTLGIQRAVLVQPSVYGMDNRVMLQALRTGGSSFRGVAVVSGEISDKELRTLHQAGVRGVRVNCVDRRERRNIVPIPYVTKLADKIKSLGWHIEFLLQVDAAADLGICHDLDVDVVFGHCGYVHADRGGEWSPGFKALLKLLDGGRCWVKLTGPYRISLDDLPYKDVSPMARALVAVAPDRLLWGSDWPHVMLSKTMPQDGALLDLLADWVPDTTKRNGILADNPAKLYDFVSTQELRHAL